MGARLSLASATVVGALLAAGCSSGAGDTADTVPVTVDDPGAPAAAPDLRGKVDRVVTMLPPGPATRPPDGALPDATVLAARHVLRAPTPDGFVELWVLRVRSQQMGPGIMECRVTVSDGSSGAGCSPIADGQAQADEVPLVGGASGDGSSIVIELNGPADMTHFVVTTPTGTIGVVPIEGQALLYFDDGCPRDTTVAAWRGNELMRDEPAVFC